jgi:hypothetical protein
VSIPRMEGREGVARLTCAAPTSSCLLRLPCRGLHGGGPRWHAPTEEREASRPTCASRGGAGGAAELVRSRDVEELGRREREGRRHSGWVGGWGR